MRRALTALTLAGLLGLLFGPWLRAQVVTNPAPAAMACAYNASPPACTSGTFCFAQCDSSGNLLVH